MPLMWFIHLNVPGRLKDLCLPGTIWPMLREHRSCAEETLCLLKSVWCAYSLERTRSPLEGNFDVELGISLVFALTAIPQEHWCSGGYGDLLAIRHKIMQCCPSNYCKVKRPHWNTIVKAQKNTLEAGDDVGWQSHSIDFFLFHAFWLDMIWWSLGRWHS